MPWVKSHIDGEWDFFDSSGTLRTWVSPLGCGYRVFSVGANLRIFKTMEAAMAYGEFAESYYVVTGEYPDPTTEI